MASAAIGHLIFGDFQLSITSALLVGSDSGAYIGAKLSTRLSGRADPAGTRLRAARLCPEAAGRRHGAHGSAAPRRGGSRRTGVDAAPQAPRFPAMPGHEPAVRAAAQLRPGGCVATRRRALVRTDTRKRGTAATVNTSDRCACSVGGRPLAWQRSSPAVPRSLIPGHEAIWLLRVGVTRSSATPSSDSSSALPAAARMWASFPAATSPRPIVPAQPRSPGTAGPDLATEAGSCRGPSPTGDLAAARSERPRWLSAADRQASVRATQVSQQGDG